MAVSLMRSGVWVGLKFRIRSHHPQRLHMPACCHPGQGNLLLCYTNTLECQSVVRMPIVVVNV